MTEQLGPQYPLDQANMSQQELHDVLGPYHADYMPMPDDPAKRAILEKQLAGDPLTLGESMRAGRDTTIDSLGEHPVRPDHVYRAVGEETLAAYRAAGSVQMPGKEDFAEGQNNGGVDWYLGGVAPKYGNVILESVADNDYFRPASDAGTGMAKDPKVRHMKSAAQAKPVTIQYVNVYRPGPDGNYVKEDR